MTRLSLITEQDNQNFEEFHLLGYNTVQPGESQRTFRSNTSMSPLKHYLTLTGLYGFISLMMDLFITTALRTSNTYQFEPSLHYFICETL
jgi:hypothetical protein